MHYLNFFTSDYLINSPTSGVITPNDLPYIRRLYLFNNDSIVKYYSERHFSVKNTHILSRLLEHFPIYPNYDVYRYLEFTNDRTTYLAKHFKFTSPIEKGIVHPSYFFGNNGEEIIISSYDYFNPAILEKNWKTESCISILKHSRNDTKFLLPLGNDDESRSGLDVLLINIPKLAIKYREFIKEQYINVNKENQIVLNKNHFVIKYILPTMIKDITDHVVLNKLMDKFYNLPEVTPKFKHRFKIFEPTIQLERYLENTLDVITSKKLDFVNILRNIQLIFKKDATELLSMENIGITRQMQWSIIVSKLDYIIFLYDVSKIKDNQNRHHLNDWSRLAKRFLRDNNIKDLFSYSQEKDIMEKLYKISNF